MRNARNNNSNNFFGLQQQKEANVEMCGLHVWRKREEIKRSVNANGEKDYAISWRVRVRDRNVATASNKIAVQCAHLARNIPYSFNILCCREYRRKEMCVRVEIYRQHEFLYNQYNYKIPFFWFSNLVCA